ncbi:MAG: hypothetical protein AAF556_02200 [Pseudomonadota bacterium]
MNFETGYAEAWAARRNPHIEQSAGNMKPAEHQHAEEDLSFWDFLDVINPLQHIPVVNSFYRELTGDTIKPATQMAGSMLFGGPVGLVSGAFNAMFEQTGGNDMVGTLVATLSDDGSIDTGADAAVQIAEAGDDGLSGVVLASSVGIESDGINSATLATDPQHTNTQHRGTQHNVTGVLADPEPLANQALLAVADSYASQQAVDQFLTLASGGASGGASDGNVVGTNPAATQLAAARTPASTTSASTTSAPTATASTDTASTDTASTTPKGSPAPSGRIQLADLPEAPAQITPAVADAEPRRQLASAKRLPADQASPMALDNVRRYNRALPLGSGLGTSFLNRDPVNAGQVAAAAKQAATQQAMQQAERDMRAAENSAYFAQPSVTRVSQPDQMPQLVPAQAPGQAQAPRLGPSAAQPFAVEDPFGRAVSGNNFSAKMIDGLEKYRAIGQLGDKGI